MDNTTTSVSTVMEKLPLNRVHYYILIAAGLGLAFDSFDTYIVSYAMPSIIREWKIDPITNGLLTSAGFWGMMLGAVVWGPFTDKFGRRIGFIGTILGFAALSGFTAFATNVYQFGILRFVTGMCLGGTIPIDTALTSEFIAARYRGKFVAFMTILWPFGLLSAAILSLTLVTRYGWRLLFIVGVIPAFLSFWIRAKVPESPRWLAIKGRMPEALSVLKTLGASDEDVQGITPDEVSKKSVPVSTLLQPQYLKRFILTSGYYFFSYFGYYGFVLWLPTILATVFHLSLVKTFTYTLFVAISAILGRIFAYYTIERFGRKQLFYVGFGLGGVAALLFGTITNPALLVWGACLLAFLYEQGVVGTVVWTAELYPSKIRTTAIGWSTAAGRVSAAISPVVFGWFVQRHMYYGVYVAMAVAFWIAVGLAFFLGTETKGKSLHELGSA
jgi:putative MFS transporter